MNATTINEIYFITTNKKRTVKEISVLNKFRTARKHKMLKARIILDLKFGRLILNRKDLNSKTNIDNMNKTLNSTKKPRMKIYMVKSITLSWLKPYLKI